MCVVAASKRLRVEFFGCAREQMPRDRTGPLRTLERPVVGVECQRRCDLIVAAAPGMQQRAGLRFELAHARVDRAVYVFRAAAARKRRKRPGLDLGGNLLQRAVQCRRRGGIDDLAAGKRIDVRHRGLHVERGEQQIVFERRTEREQRSIRRRAKPTAPLETCHAASLTDPSVTHRVE